MTKKKLDIFFTDQDFSIDTKEFTKTKNLYSLDEEKFINNFEHNKFLTIYNLSFTKEIPYGPGIIFLCKTFQMMIKKIIQDPSVEINKGNVDIPMIQDLYTDIYNLVPWGHDLNSGKINYQWVENLWYSVLKVFNQECKEYQGTVEEYINSKNANLHVADRIFFHLAEYNDPEYPFAFLATYSAQKEQDQKTYHTPLNKAFKEYKNDTMKLLSLISTVIKISKESDFINSLVESNELFSPIKLTIKEASIFLKEVDLYEKYGIVCVVPNWWKRKSQRPKPSLSIKLEDEKSILSIDNIINFVPQAEINGQKLSEDDLYALLDQDEGLFRFKNEWVEINKEQIKDLLEAIKKLKKNPTISVKSLISNQFALDSNTKFDDKINQQIVKIFFDKLNNTITKNKKTLDTSIPKTINANLREYQKEGVEWLLEMHSLNLGVCLADDMGLGKTLQVLTFLDKLRSKKQIKKVLLVVPASLLSNWKAEIKRFAKNISFKILHRTDNNDDFENSINDQTLLYITTYGMVSKIQNLVKTDFDIVILDEAQNIKNPTTIQTKAIKNLKSNMQIALTGTPIENNLVDLWSIFDFINPGLLGNLTQFKRFIHKTDEDLELLERLKKTINAFVLRRLKTDKKIISDLPEKIEYKDIVELSPKQAALYLKIVDEIKEKIEGKSGIARTGLIFSSLTKLKQICNHPNLFLGKNDDFKLSHSGKMTYIKNLCETIANKKEKVLVFTQYTEFIPLLNECLKQIFKSEGLILHGKTPIKQRGKLVDEFNNNDKYIPYMILSLKAAGVGLNLTSANHVIHFDRWWNPAAENQATDRTYRIGQTKNVVVRKLITQGTIEEKIDNLIESKMELAQDLLNIEGSKYLTEMTNEEILNLIRLDKNDY